MRIRVIKFGGTSVSTRERRAIAARRVLEVLAEGIAPVVIVSAFGRRGEPYATDTLMELVRGANPDMPPRETAMLAGCGEIIASVIMSGVLLGAGARALALTGPQAGVRTEDGYTAANVRSVDTAPLLAYLREGRVPVVAGFQGATESGELAVLDRGGSDVSATALGYALGAERVDIFTDVPGVMTADPAVVPNARPIDKVTYDEAILMARLGAKVIHPDAVVWAKRGSVPVRICSTFDEREGTHIGVDAPVRDAQPLGVTCQAGDRGEATVSVVGMAAERATSVAARVAAELRAAQIHCSKLWLQPGAVMVSVRTDEMVPAARALHARLLARQPDAPGLAARSGSMGEATGDSQAEQLE